jgi:predicted lipoprotein with Yx(FWY)xxD motif
MRLSIKNPLTVLAAVAVAALVLAACGGSDDNGSATAANAGAQSGVASVRNVDGTDVLANSQGHTLYSADVEENGKIKCTGMCTSFWDPVTASAKQAKSASDQLDLELGTVKRPDGAQQLTLAGLPLYTFTEEGAGQLEGDGFEDDFNGTHFVWEAAGSGSSSAGSGTQPSNSPY